MSQKQNPLSTIAPWDLVACGYAETTMHILAHYAEEAIAACKLKRGASILDVACGPRHACAHGCTRGWHRARHRFLRSHARYLSATR